MHKNAFHQHIQAALADPNLQAALDANAERRLGGRSQALGTLPQSWEYMRHRAHAVRAVTVAHLDELLSQFVERAQANGMIVLRAVDGAQAIQQVLEIARQNGARLVAKSKTMVSEEIDLNPALEAGGLQVVETDLGEYIVQLRGERPAHIITPAVHLRRGEVGQTFHEKLGLPLTEDIPTLTSAARRVLRQVFLDADLGISGVNFGVAESGTLCLVTNEGNGRMVTTLPRVHIALMGIERLVPTLDDLALMLYLLPRSATGQKLSVYTSLIQSPAREGEQDGAQKRYVILVDNGRTSMRRSPLAEALYCIRCGACLNACPVFRELGGHAYVNLEGESSAYPGPIGSVISPALFGQAEFGHLARASSLCGACREVCPVDIDLPGLLLRVRAGKTVEVNLQAGSPPRTQAYRSNTPTPLALSLRMFTWVATSPSRFSLAQRALGIAGKLASPVSGWLRLPAFTGWGYSKDFPRPAIQPFRARWEALKAQISDAREVNPSLTRPASDSEASSRGERHTVSSSRVERFALELIALGGEFIACEKSELVQRILDILDQRGIKALAAWEEQYFPNGLLNNLAGKGIMISHQPDASIRAGLTGVSAAIAETGSLLLCGGLGRPLTASLLPEVHIVVMHADEIRDDLPKIFELRELREASSAVLITGPSRTADIEMTLTIGVHGPGELIVFCLTDI
jgi:L-lactate dehydrogenase complex protein LldF